jgi:hypothetical protein
MPFWCPWVRGCLISLSWPLSASREGYFERLKPEE